MAKFFIDRPIFAAVISIIITLAGGIAVFLLSVAQYPEITPPTVQVSCNYPGASSKVVAETVAAPIEQQVIGVENMLYMSSQSTNDGGYNLTVTFKVGTNLDMAQVLVQNRVNLALPSLPSEVKQTGVSVKKKSPNILLVVNLVSPKGTYDQLYLSNYATIQVRDELAQISGVGDVTYRGNSTTACVRGSIPIAWRRENCLHPMLLTPCASRTYKWQRARSDARQCPKARHFNTP